MCEAICQLQLGSLVGMYSTPELTNEQGALAVLSLPPEYSEDKFSHSFYLE
jgi:hypothetical protein